MVVGENCLLQYVEKSPIKATTTTKYSKLHFYPLLQENNKIGGSKGNYGKKVN